MILSFGDLTESIYFFLYMSFFIDTIRKRVGDIFFQRGKKYFKEGFATIKETKPTENGMIFKGVVRGSTDYETSILVEFSPKTKLKFFCSCPAFDDHSGRCKHIAALALSIEKEYIIDDQNQQIIKKSDTVVDMSGSDTTGSIEEMLVTALKNNLNVSPDRFLEYLTSHGYDIEDIMSLLHKERNNIGGVSSPSVKTPHILKLLETPSTLMTEERHYRFKLDFSGGKNLYLSLYECKVLKNGSLSSGRELSQVDGRHMRGEYKKYIPFLEGRGYYYNS